MAAPAVFVSADVEGVSGYVDPEEDAEQATRRAMAADVNAAIEGVLDAEPDASVTVADSHGDKRTIPPAELHEVASLVRGGPRPYGMVDGVTDDHDLAMLVGYHDRPGTGGVLEHTFTGSIADVRLDGRAVGEVELNAALLAHHDVPVALVTGDDRLGETVADALPDAEYVETKQRRGASAATCRHPTAVRCDIRDAATSAVTDPPAATGTQEFAFDSPLRVAVEFANAEYADVATLWPDVDRGPDSRTVVHDAGDVPTAYQFVRATTKIST